MVGLAVSADYTGPVDGKDHRKLLQTDVLQDLVIGSLQERRVDRHDGPHTRLCQSSREGDAVGFRDAYVKEAAGIALGKRPQSRSVAHGRRNRADPLVLLGQMQRGKAEDLRVGHDRRCQHLSRFRVERPDPVEFIRILLRRSVAFALLRHHVDENRAGGLLCQFQHLHGLRKIVAVHRSEIGEAQFLKDDAAGQQRVFDPVLKVAQIHRQLVSDDGNVLHRPFDGLLRLQIACAGPQL